MQKNVMSEVVKLLGLEIGESFMVDECIYMIDKDGLWKKEYGKWRCSGDLENLLTGRKKIVTLPWKLKIGNKYWTFHCNCGRDWSVIEDTWGGYVGEIARLKVGWVFKTKEKAEEVLPEVEKEFLAENE